MFTCSTRFSGFICLRVTGLGMQLGVLASSNWGRSQPLCLQGALPTLPSAHQLPTALPLTQLRDFPLPAPAYPGKTPQAAVACARMRAPPRFEPPPAGPFPSPRAIGCARRRSTTPPPASDATQPRPPCSYSRGVQMKPPWKAHAAQLLERLSVCGRATSRAAPDHLRRAAPGRRRR